MKIETTAVFPYVRESKSYEELLLAIRQFQHNEFVDFANSIFGGDGRVSVSELQKIKCTFVTSGQLAGSSADSLRCGLLSALAICHELTHVDFSKPWHYYSVTFTYEQED